jgi:hypothetical protein
VAIGKLPAREWNPKKYHGDRGMCARLAALSVFGLLVVTLNSAGAAVISYTATGNALSNDSSLGITIGNPLSLSFTYNSATGAEDGSGPNQIGYIDAITNVSVTGLPGQVAVGQAEVSVADQNAFGFSGDSVLVPMTYGGSAYFLSLNLPTAETNTNLPSALPTFGSLSSSYVGSNAGFNLGLVVQDPHNQLVDFGLNSFAAAPVPLPASAWLMLSGLGGFGAWARKKRAC